MPAVETDQRIARMRAIVAFKIRGRDDTARVALFKMAGIEPGQWKNWNDASKPTLAPTIDDLIQLADAAGVPRRFAERGFADLREPRDSDVHQLMRETEDLRLALAAQGESVLAATSQLVALQEQVDRLQRQQQP